jgi:hypothetical protein
MLMNDRHEFYQFTPNDLTTWLQRYAVRDNSCNWCRYGFAATLRYETMLELTQQRIKQLKTRFTD